MFAANGTTVLTYGCITLRLDFGLRPEFSFRFVVADVTGPIIGSYFLLFYNLLVDVRRRRLNDITTLTVNGDPAETSGGQFKVLAGSSRYHNTILDFPEIIAPQTSPGNPDTLLYTTPGPPASSRPRRLKPDRIRIAKSEFEEMPRIGTTRCSYSPWASPLYLVQKKEDGWGPCGDYGVLNAWTVPDQYPVRHIADFAHQLAFRKVFSTIGLIKAYPRSQFIRRRC